LRRFPIIALAAMAVLVTACGETNVTPKAAATPAGQSAAGKLTPPTVDGRSNEASASGTDQVVAGSGARAGVRGKKPCGLVSAAQATAIFGTAIEKPVEAAQGPTCVYRTRKGKGFVSVSVQSLDLARLRKQLQQSSKLEIADHTAYCGTYGQPMLYAGVSDGYVLSIAGPCDVAARFAGKALPKLTG
jgi:hypothetical protein